MQNQYNTLKYKHIPSTAARTELGSVFKSKVILLCQMKVNEQTLQFFSPISSASDWLTLNLQDSSLNI